MGWKTYATAMLVFNLAGMLLLYALKRIQGALPHPQGFGAISADRAPELRA
jgi:K+-transporting ATPase ATPase A chain